MSDELKLYKNNFVVVCCGCFAAFEMAPDQLLTL